MVASTVIGPPPSETPYTILAPWYAVISHVAMGFNFKKHAIRLIKWGVIKWGGQPDSDPSQMANCIKYRNINNNNNRRLVTLADTIQKYCILIVQTLNSSNIILLQCLSPNDNITLILPVLLLLLPLLLIIIGLSSGRSH